MTTFRAATGHEVQITEEVIISTTTEDFILLHAGNIISEPVCVVQTST